MDAFQPNILIILTEDLSPHSATYGDKLSPMKTVDAIAKDALVFENAFCTSPVCSPSRFAMMTGMEPASVGPAHQMRADGIVPDSVKLITAPLKEDGYYCINIGKADYNFEPNMQTAWDDYAITAHWRNRAADQPFFAFFNLIETHESSLFREQVTLVSPDDIELPPYLPDTQEIREDFARYYTAMKKSDDHIEQILAQLEEDGLTEQTVIIQISDHGGSTPRSKRFIYDSGNKIPLVIKIPASMEETRIWRDPQRIKTAVSLIDLAPTVCDIAGGLNVPETMTGRSLLTVAGSDAERMVFTGRDRMDENYDMIRTVRTAKNLYIRNYFPNRPWLQNQAYAWQAKGFQSWETEYLAGRTTELQSRYFGEKPPEEFYDNQADPHQVNNLIDSPEHQVEIQRYRAALDARTLEIFDNGFIPEGSAIEGLENSRNATLYPLSEVLALANLTIARDVANLEAFVLALKHENEVMRFWAAQGLLVLDEEAKPAAAELLAASSDSNGHIRALVAETLAKLGHRESAIAIFRELLKASSTFQVLIRAAKSAAAVQPALVELTDQVKQLLEVLSTDDYDEPGYFNAYTGMKYLASIVEGTYSPTSKIFDDALFIGRLQKSSPGLIASMGNPRG